jgi:hypothetical protein
MAPTLKDGLRTARRDPAFALYLLAVATLGVKWVSPLSSFYPEAIWSDVLIGAAAVVWLFSRLARREFPRPRLFHLALGLYVAAGFVSLAFASDLTLGAKTLLLMAELCVLAFLTSEFASEPGGIQAIVWTVVFVTLYTAILAVVGLALFYAHIHTSILGAYGEQYVASNRYARIAAGFESPPFLGSFCIFASALVAREDVSIPRHLRLVTQMALAALVLLTFARAIIGFAAAIAIRAGYRHRRSRRARAAAIAFVVASIAVIAALTAGRFHLDPTRPSTITYTVPDPHNRRQAFVTSLDTLGDHPIVGEGPGSLTGLNRRAPFRAHMTALNVAATMGVPALAALTFIIVVLWRNRRRPIPIATWSGLAGLAIDGLAQDVDHFRHVWILLGVADSERRPAADAATTTTLAADHAGARARGLRSP